MIFHTSAWLDFVAGYYNFEQCRLGVFGGQELIGLFPILTRKLGPFRLAGSPLAALTASTPYLGPLVSPETLVETIHALDAWMCDQRIDHLEIGFPVHLDARLFRSIGYQIESCDHVGLQLRGCTLSQLWNGLTPACRRAVRKAETNQVVVRDAESPGFLNDYAVMCQEVYRGAGRPPHLSADFYMALWDSVRPTGMLKVLLAEREGKLLAGGFFLTYGLSAYYLSGASYDWGQTFRPNNLIQWRFIEWLMGQGYEYYDLGGTTVAGITRFKLGFGARLAPFTRMNRANSSLSWLGRKMYQGLVPVWRKLQVYIERSGLCHSPDRSKSLNR
jgi:hypothetical protein